MLGVKSAVFLIPYRKVNYLWFILTEWVELAQPRIWHTIGVQLTNSVSVHLNPFCSILLPNTALRHLGHAVPPIYMFPTSYIYALIILHTYSYLVVFKSNLP